MDNKSKKKSKSNDKSVEEEVEDLETMEKVSYTYWKRESDNPFSNEFKPQKSDTNLDENKPIQTNTTGVTASAWNTAGTWEEKHLNKNKLEQFLNNGLHDKNLVFQNSFIIENFTGYTGDVKLLIY